MQRLHVDDLAGHLIGKGGWTCLELPARAEADTVYELDDHTTYTFKAGQLLHPARLGEKELEERRHSLGTAAFYAQYMQAPIPPAGGIFKWPWFKRYDANHPKFSELFLSVDVAATANGGNYSAFTIWGHRDGIWYLVAAYRGQYELPQVRETIIRLDKECRPDLVVIDSNGIGKGLLQELRKQGFRHCGGVRGKGRQIDAEAIAPMIEAGRVRVRHDVPGINAFRDEVIAFPNGKYSDQVDSMAQLLCQGQQAVNLARRYKRHERRNIKSTGSQIRVKVTKISAPNNNYGW